jgi:hypothetical protein
MRSTNLVLVLVFMNAAAGIVAVAAPVGVDPVAGGDEQIEQSSTELEDNRTVNRRGSGELIGSFLALGGLINTLGNIIFFGPEMLRNLGAPGILITGFETILIFVVGFDVAEAITGRRLS